MRNLSFVATAHSFVSHPRQCGAHARARNSHASRNAPQLLSAPGLLALSGPGHSEKNKLRANPQGGGLKARKGAHSEGLPHPVKTCQLAGPPGYGPCLPPRQAACLLDAAYAAAQLNELHGLYPWATVGIPRRAPLARTWIGPLFRGGPRMQQK